MTMDCGNKPGNPERTHTAHKHHKGRPVVLWLSTTASLCIPGAFFHRNNSLYHWNWVNYHDWYNNCLLTMLPSQCGCVLTPLCGKIRDYIQWSQNYTAILYFSFCVLYIKSFSAALLTVKPKSDFMLSLYFAILFDFVTDSRLQKKLPVFAFMHSGVPAYKERCSLAALQH